MGSISNENVQTIAAASCRRSLDNPPAGTSVGDPSVQDDLSPHRSTHESEAEEEGDVGQDENEEENCLICLSTIQDRTVLPACQHSLFCFACILRWCAIHRRCPLCSTAIGTYLLHSIRSPVDYVRHRLPLASKGSAELDLVSHEDDPLVVSHPRQSSRRRQPSLSPHNGQQARRAAALQRWDEQLSRRRRIYRQGLYCLHVGTNRSSGLGPPVTPSILASTASLQSCLLHFLHRELLALPLSHLDVDFLSTYCLEVWRCLDVRSSEAVGLLAEFLGNDLAQHLSHEVYTFLRFVAQGSGRHNDKLAAFDAWASYAWPEREIEQRIRESTSLGSQGRAAEMKEKDNGAAPSVPGISATQETSTEEFRREVIQRRRQLLDRLVAGSSPASEASLTGQKAPVSDPTNQTEREEILRELLRTRRSAAQATKAPSMPS